MTKGTQREVLSALLDDEASDLEARRAVRDMDATDQATLSRWQLARDIITGHQAAPVPEGFAARVSAQLEPHRSTSPWLARMGRVAVAASVAAATVVGWQYYGAGSQSPAAPSMAEARDSRLNVPVASPALVAGGAAEQGKADSAGVASGDVGQRLDNMVLRHNDLSARHSGQGATPYARLISQQAGHGSR